MQYSLVIPLHNEGGSLRLLTQGIMGTMDSLEENYEIIFVNDGSTDGSLWVLEALRNSFPEKIVILNLPKRRGQTFAMREGLKAVRGQIVITLDADLQNDPADIPKLLAKLTAGFDVVCGWRKQRHDKPLKKLLSKLGNILQRLLTGLKIHDVSCTLRAYKAECIEKIPLYWEGQHRFIPLSLSRQGYSIGEVITNHRARRYGSSKYSHKRIFKVIVDFCRVLRERAQV